MLWIVDMIALLIGLAACFLGYRLFRAWLTVAGFLYGAAWGYYVGSRFLTAEVWQIVAAVVVGLLFACLAYFLYRISAVLAGANLGALLFISLMAALNIPVTWWFFFIGAAIGGLIAGFFLKYFIIVGSAFQGAYLAAIGLWSMLSAQSLFEQKNGIVLDFKLPWYIYIGVLLLTAVGAAVQLSMSKGQEDPF